jgi:hypothetical protein
MAGMAIASITGDRIFLIEVSGVRHQNVSKKGAYTLKVPQNRLSQTMQSIQQTGGTIKRVSALFPTAEVKVTSPRPVESTQAAKGKSKKK